MKKARWVLYRVLAGAIAILVVTRLQNQKSIWSEDYSYSIEPENKEILIQAEDRIPLQLKINNWGKKIEHRLERTYEDIFIVIESDFNSRRLEILCMEPRS